MKLRPALLDRNGDVIGEIYEAPEKGNWIDVAGALTVSGDPVNVKKYRISRSKKNMRKAYDKSSVYKIGDNFWRIEE